MQQKQKNKEMEKLEIGIFEGKWMILFLHIQICLFQVQGYDSNEKPPDSNQQESGGAVIPPCIQGLSTDFGLKKHLSVSFSFPHR